MRAPSPAPQRKLALPRKQWLLLGSCALILGISVFLIPGSEWLRGATGAAVSTAVVLPVPAAKPVAPPPVLPPPIQHTVRSGETLSEVFEDLGMGSDEVQSAVTAIRPHLDPRRVRSGDLYLASYDPSRQLVGFEMAVTGRGRVKLSREGDAWSSSFTPVVREVRRRVVSGELQDFLEAAVRGADADPMLAYQMADVLQWDLDFARDLRVGDKFQILFDEVYLDGAYDSVGEIVALRYENRGRALEAYRYGEGYYDAEGRPLKKMFLRAPLRFTRVTSGFSHRRFHPVLHTFRPHYGVDYGAPVGTPVMATANGTVSFAGWDGGGGKTVKLRHPGGYTTCYLHLSRFADGVRPGRAVHQGDVVGFVGKTGLATGAHLDYRVNLNGRWIDPLSLTTVPARPITGAELATFRARRAVDAASLAAGKPLDLPADPQTRLARSIDAPAPAGASELATARK